MSISAIITTLSVIVSVLLIGIVLIQKSKGGGLSSQFGNASAVMGVRQTNTFLEKGTWWLFGIIVFLSIVSAIVANKSKEAYGDSPKSATEAPAPTGHESYPAVPTTAPEAN